MKTSILFLFGVILNTLYKQPFRYEPICDKKSMFSQYMLVIL